MSSSRPPSRDGRKVLLDISNDSRKIKKPPLPPPKTVVKYEKEPTTIHVRTPEDFKYIVQLLTGDPSRPPPVHPSSCHDDNPDPPPHRPQGILSPTSLPPVFSPDFFTPSLPPPPSQPLPPSPIPILLPPNFSHHAFTLSPLPLSPTPTPLPPDFSLDDFTLSPLPLSPTPTSLPPDFSLDDFTLSPLPLSPTPTSLPPDFSLDDFTLSPLPLSPTLPSSLPVLPPDDSTLSPPPSPSVPLPLSPSSDKELYIYDSGNWVEPSKSSHPKDNPPPPPPPPPLPPIPHFRIPPSPFRMLNSDIPLTFNTPMPPDLFDPPYHFPHND